ncbi:hypothetical protein Acid345_3811 [Candidatus Koribacter versatilis Ellin345]|uniref:Uncharacterized protein n=1 Tax=Koribacter versatilis (strain Ellin345) TaxID=204669 RepID=Q1IJY9_KORVE|nr:hypothetical protein [Candidatus Koribacter versatilis]ABF42811.1 hypothetical protein Acid345_3811 [Candidatus Koribacter versatilis Ellin345]
MLSKPDLEYALQILAHREAVSPNQSSDDVLMTKYYAMSVSVVAIIASRVGFTNPSSPSAPSFLNARSFQRDYYLNSGASSTPPLRSAEVA